MGATLKVISGRVGEGGQQSGMELRRVQQLLARSLMLREGDVSGNWSRQTKEAILDFKEFFQVPEKERTACLGPDDPYDLVLNLCKCAGVLLSIPSDKSGAGALMEFFNAAVEHKIPYGWAGAGGADRVAYGLAGNPDYLIFTNTKMQFDVDDCPIAMNCISFSNLALSIWRTGQAHAYPYDSNQSGGGFVSLGLRYDMDYLHNKRRVASGEAWSPFNLSFAGGGAQRAVSLPSPLSSETSETYFYSVDEVLTAVEPNRLYYLQWCRLKDTARKVKDKTVVYASGFGHHDTVLYNGDVYEINIPKPHLRKTSLYERFKTSPEAVRVMGPV